MDDGAVGSFTTNRIATSGCEIRDPDGFTIAWAVDEPWAAMIAGLLNRVEAEGLSSVFKMQQRVLEEREATPCKAWQPDL